MTCQENDFENPSGTTDYETVGIFCKDIGTHNNQIRKNSFDGLSRGNLANGGNGNDPSNPNQPIRGLSYICNENTNILAGGFDIDVAQDEDNAGVTSYIRSIQGEGTNTSAGNIFSDGAAMSPATGIFNSNPADLILFPNEKIDYWYSGMEEPSVEGNVSTAAVSDPNSCPTDFCEPPCNTDGVINGIKNQYYNTKAAYTNLGVDFNNNPTEQKARTLAAYRLELDQSAYAVVLHELYDTINYSPDTLRVWVRNMDNIGAEMWIANERLASGNPQEAIAVLDAIPQHFALTTAQSADLQKYRNITMLLQNVSIDNLSSGTIETLQSYENVGGHTEYRVRNILTGYGYHYPPEYAFSKGANAEENEQEEEESKNQKTVLTVFPNPAKDFVIFSVQQGDNETVSTLLVRDLNGRLIYSETGIAGDSRIEWKTEGVPSGIYFYQLVSDRGEAQSGKVILNK